MSFKKRVVLAIVLSLLFVSISTGYETRPIEPLPSTAFTRVDVIPKITFTPALTPGVKPTPTPTPKPTKAPPRPQKTSKPKVVTKILETRVRSIVSVKVGARIAKAYARERMNSTQFACLEILWKHESGWRWNAQNRSSGAYGIPQALPGSKMATKGSDWRTNPITQVRWGLGYISGRYGTPCKAWNHFQNRGWY